MSASCGASVHTEGPGSVNPTEDHLQKAGTKFYPKEILARRNCVHKNNAQNRTNGIPACVQRVLREADLLPAIWTRLLGWLYKYGWPVKGSTRPHITRVASKVYCKGQYLTHSWNSLSTCGLDGEPPTLKYSEQGVKLICFTFGMKTTLFLLSQRFSYRPLIVKYTFPGMQRGEYFFPRSLPFRYHSHCRGNRSISVGALSNK